MKIFKYLAHFLILGTFSEYFSSKKGRSNIARRIYCSGRKKRHLLFVLIIILIVLNLPFIFSSYFTESKSGSAEPNSGNVPIDSADSASAVSTFDLSYLTNLDSSQAVSGDRVGLNYDIEQPLNEGGGVYVNDGSSLVRDG